MADHILLTTITASATDYEQYDYDHDNNPDQTSPNQVSACECDSKELNGKPTAIDAELI